ncbi:DUF3305 domain-containing protein [uncultured Roseibium sp.]|uniref:DUF3305 domain-containing protein n=1 Tax=uncultured Roseibium sp. TaxID=1936171 RepID=UPI00374A8C2C
MVQYHYAPVPLTLHRKLGEAYDANVETETPSLWILLDDAETEPVPYKVRGVTADPYEAMGSCSIPAKASSNGCRCRQSWCVWMADYMRQMPEPEKFKKRKAHRSHGGRDRNSARSRSLTATTGPRGRGNERESAGRRRLP